MRVLHGSEYKHWHGARGTGFKLMRNVCCVGPAWLWLSALWSCFVALWPLSRADAYDVWIANERKTEPVYYSMVASVEAAIETDIQPELITQGSSGSYFAKNCDHTTAPPLCHAPLPNRMIHI